MALNTAQLWGAVEPVVRKKYGLEKSKRKAEFSQIFDVSKGKEAIRHSMEFGGTGQVTLKNENAPMGSLTIRQGNDKTWYYSLYAGQITLSWELARDVNYRAIKTVAGSLGRSISLTPEYLAAQFLDRSFNSAYPAVADGNELCATDHTIIGTNATTGSNTFTTAEPLSETGLEDVMTNLLTMTGPDGMIVDCRPEAVIVPAGLSVLADKLKASTKTLGSANNDPSVVNGMKTICFRYLSSATRWFVKTDWDNGLFWEWDVESEFMEDNSPTTLQKVYVAFFRARWGCDDWRGIYGSNAT